MSQSLLSAVKWLAVIGRLEAAGPSGLNRRACLTWFAHHPQECRKALLRNREEAVVVDVLPGILWLYLSKDGKAARPALDAYEATL